jgi:hypothetical protein
MSRADPNVGKSRSGTSSVTLRAEPRPESGLKAATLRRSRGAWSLSGVRNVEPAR